MKPLRLLLLLLFTIPIGARAQWQKRVGINMIPLAIRTIELTSEFTNHPAYALTVNAGYVYKSAFEGLNTIKIYDGIEDRQTSGLFIKMGVRIYLLSLTGREPSFNLFVGTQVIGSQYRQQAMSHLIDPGFSPNAPSVIPIQANGFLWGTALSGGATFRFSQKLALDAGLQFGFQPTRTDYLGDRTFNYQPGFGVTRSGKSATSVQGILALKYRL